MGIVEELGSGIRKMFKYTPLYANGKEPIIEEQDVYRIEIPYIPTLQGSDVDTTQKTTQKILDQIKANPYISRQELAELCGLTSDGIKYNIRKLREKGIIKRIGPDKGGHWEVVGD
jgi:ATP-dependent DNA helicase RecG